MNVETILKTMLMIGSDLPAYKALFDHVVTLLSVQDQPALRAAYDDAMTAAAQAHREAQA